MVIPKIPPIPPAVFGVEMISFCKSMLSAITLCVTDTSALADLVVSATLVAVTVRSVPEATPARDKSPEEEIVPAVVDHVTPVFCVPVTVAVNCSVPADGTETEVGEIVTATTGAVTVMVVVPDFVVSSV